MMRVGQGYDIHRLTDGDGFVLGGIKIAAPYAMVAHSDGDVLYHAICDALLGALALGDIGRHFPDTDPALSNHDSRHFVVFAISEMKRRGYELVNLDATIIAQRPKLQNYIPSMCENLQVLFNCQLDQTNIKAKTNERLDSIGACQAIAVHVNVLLSKSMNAI